MNSPTPEALNVSRETFERLSHYVDLLNKWAPRINLVSRSTLEDVWTRHIRDSLQVLRAADGLSGHWVDLGSGGGLPGAIVALAAPGGISRVTLVESDQRKCAFLRTVFRETGVAAEVLSERIKAAAPQQADILSARALAPLPQLLDFACRHLSSDGTAIFPKGVNWKNEVTEAAKTFSFDLEQINSETQNGAVLLRIGDISRV